jgi:Ca2+/Na+ antiporter
VATLAGDITAIHQKRLHELEKIAARFGYETSPQILTEIEQIKEQLAAAAPTTVAESHTILYDLVLRIDARLDRLYSHLLIGLFILAIIFLVWR